MHFLKLQWLFTFCMCVYTCMFWSTLLPVMPVAIRLNRPRPRSGWGPATTSSQNFSSILFLFLLLFLDLVCEAWHMFLLTSLYIYLWKLVPLLLKLARMKEVLGKNMALTKREKMQKSEKRWGLSYSSGKTTGGNLNFIWDNIQPLLHCKYYFI